MDDPWANAWGEPSSAVSLGHGQSIVQPSWALATQEPTTGDDQEADIGMPSWSAGTGVLWNEPSASENSLWSQQTTGTEHWQPTSYDHIPVGRTISQKPPSPPRIPSPKPDNSDTTFSLSHSSRSPPKEIGSMPSPLATVSEPSETPPESPDAFGTFESAEADPPWASASVSALNLDANEWEPAWGSEPVAVSGKRQQKPPDEWEEAKRRKEMQDRRVVSYDLPLLQFYHSLVSSLRSV